MQQLGIKSTINETLTSKVMVQIKLKINQNHCGPTEEPSLLLRVVPAAPHRHSLQRWHKAGSAATTCLICKCRRPASGQRLFSYQAAAVEKKKQLDANDGDGRALF